MDFHLSQAVLEHNLQDRQGITVLHLDFIIQALTIFEFQCVRGRCCVENALDQHFFSICMLYAKPAVACSSPQHADLDTPTLLFQLETFLLEFLNQVLIDSNFHHFYIDFLTQ